MPNGYSVAIWIAAITMASFAFILSLSNKKPSTRASVLFVLLAAYWAAGVGLFYYLADEPTLYYVVIYNHAMGIAIATAFFFFSYLLGQNKMPPKPITALVLASGSILVTLYISMGELLIRSVYLGAEVAARGWMYGPLVYIHYVYFLGAFAGGIAILHLHANRGATEDRPYLHALDRAALIGIIPIIIIIFVLRAFGFANLLWVAPFLGLGWIILASYALVSFHVQSFKLFLAEALVLTMAILLFANIFITERVFDEIAKVFIFIIFSGAGLVFLAQIQRSDRQQRELIVLNKKLRDATDRLTEANFTLKEVAEQKSQLMSFASHQIKNPLTSIKGFASLIAEGTLGKVSKKAEQAARTILLSSNTLVHTVDDFLASSRIELGQMEYVKTGVELGSIVAEIVELLSVQAEKKRINAVLHPAAVPLVVHGDKEKLRHAIFNVIDNAIKYTDAGTVMISLAPDPTTNEAVIEVTDTGIGMVPDATQRIFERFYRLETGGTQGSGLGLYLAREIIRAHGGTITARSRGANKGSTFVIRIPELA